MFNRYNLRATNYSAINAYLTMVASHKIFAFAYDSRLPRNAYKAPATAFFRTNGFVDVDFINGGLTGADGIVASNDRYAMLVIRGSETELHVQSLLDWFTNSRIRQVTGRARFGGALSRVHVGFRDAANSLQAPIRRALQNADVAPRGDKPIVVCGHSLGAATATLVAHMLIVAGYRVQAVYAHASPMVGNAAFGRSVARQNVPFFRTVNKSDPVPEFPQAFIDIGTALTSVPGQIPPVRAAVDLISNIPSVRNFISTPYQQAPVTLAYIRRRGGISMNPSRETLVNDRGPYLDFENHKTYHYLNALFLALPLATRRRVPLIS